MPATRHIPSLYPLRLEQCCRRSSPGSSLLDRDVPGNRHRQHDREYQRTKRQNTRHSGCHIHAGGFFRSLLVHIHWRQTWSDQDYATRSHGRYSGHDHPGLIVLSPAVDSRSICDWTWTWDSLSPTAPNWQSECSQSKHRGAAVVLESVFISAGLALSAWFNLGMGFVRDSISWRLPLAMSAVWAVIVLVAVGFLPESPRWLLLMDRSAEAKEALAALGGKDPDDALVREAVAEIANSIQITERGRFFDVFRNGELRLFNRACLACAGQMFQQLTGINAIAFFQTTIFRQYLGLPSTTARVLTASLFTFQTLCSPIGVLT